MRPDAAPVGEAHPLLAGTDRAYWLSDAGCEAAQVAVAEAVEQLLAATAQTLDPQRQWSPRFWRMGLGSFFWALGSHVFDRASDPLPERPLPPLPAPAFSSRDFVLALPDAPEIKPWIDAAIAGLAPAACAARVAAALAAVSLDAPQRHKRTPARLDGLAGRLRRALMFWEGEAEVVHYAAPFSHAQARALTLRARGRIRRLPCPERPDRLRYDGALRAAWLPQLLSAVADAGPLARLLAVPAAALMPTAFVEQRDALAVWADRRQRPRVLASALGFERSPYFAALADRAHRSGGTIVGIQHGGYYGQTDPAWSELLENQISDVYCTWGYRHADHHRPMPSVRLSQIAPRSGRPSGSRRVLLATSASVSYSAVLARFPHYRREDELDAWMIPLLREAMQALGIDLAIRPYPRLGRDLLSPQWARDLPEARVEPPAGRGLLQHAAEHDLLLFNFPGATGFLEALAAGQPAMIFCPQRFCPLRPEARAAFQGLIDTGVYATDRDSFLSALSQWQAQGSRWLDEPARAAALRAFAHSHARTDAHATQAWAAFLVEAGRVQNAPRTADAAH